MASSKEQIFLYSIFCNIIKVLTVTLMCPSQMYF